MPRGMTVEPNCREVAVPAAPPPVGIEIQEGAAALAPLLPSMVPAGAWDKVKERLGVVEALATEVVNKGERVPAENVVTVPVPPPPVPPIAVNAVELPGDQNSCPAELAAIAAKALVGGVGSPAAA